MGVNEMDGSGIMERIKLRDDLSFSRIIQGHWRLADWGYTDQELLGFTKEALGLGITTIDTADIYGGGSCESQFGKALSLEPSLRDKLEIVTKCGIRLAGTDSPVSVNHYDSGKSHIVRSAEASLRRLGTEYIDVLLIHRPDFLTDPEETAEAFSELKKAGKVRYFGVSNFKPSQLEMLSACLDEPLVTNQIEISVMERLYFENGGLDWSVLHKMPLMAWSPLAGGRVFTEEGERETRIRNTLKKVAGELGTDHIDQVMYAWLLRHPAKIMPIAGSGKLERLNRAKEALDIQMSREQWYEIWVSSLGRNVD